MRCVKPFVSGKVAFGCGQCMPCRSIRLKTWAHRIMLEAGDHAECSFVTLTYGGDRRDLVPKDLQDWLKRFRKFISPRKVRYFAVGEYGDNTGRPHYHAALFGWPACYGRTNAGECQCPACLGVRQTWGFGHVMVGRLEIRSAKYIAGYCMKKMTHRLDVRLGGREPEFTRMSLKPGIGANAMWNVASTVLQYRQGDIDVPAGLQYSKNSVLPLGRYLRRKLREYAGRDVSTPPESLSHQSEALQVLRAFAWANDRSVSSVFEEINGPYQDKISARYSIREKRL